MNYEIFEAFPIPFYVGELNNHKKYKENFYKLYDKYDYEDTEYDNTVSENVGKPFIHLEDSLQPLFEDVITHIKSYVYDVLDYKEIFNFLITKSWLSRSRKARDELRWHIHSTSHVSFVYYLNCPSQSHNIVFENPHNKNSLFLGSTAISKLDERVMVKEQNQYNTETFFISPVEGTLLLFPSSITHCTRAVSDTFNDERLAIVGDVTLVLQEDNLQYSMGYIDPKYWKMFV